MECLRDPLVGRPGDEVKEHSKNVRRKRVIHDT